MKKLIAGLLMAFMMSAGLVATTAVPASADCGYEKCSGTKTAAKVLKAKARFLARIQVDVGRTGKNRGPLDGTLTFSCAKPLKSGKIKQISYTEDLREGNNVYKFKLRPKGNWSCNIVYVPDPDGPYESSSTTVNVKVDNRNG